MNTLSLHNDDEESVIAKYRSKVKEDKTINVNNWDKRFDKLKGTHSEEQDSSEIDNLKKYAEKSTTNENCQIHHNYDKNRLLQLPLITQMQSTKILSNAPLTQDEIDILKLGLSSTPTPKQNIAELENDIF